jgi:hypothetical protein
MKGDRPDAWMMNSRGSADISIYPPCVIGRTQSQMCDALSVRESNEDLIITAPNVITRMTIDQHAGGRTAILG